MQTYIYYSKASFHILLLSSLSLSLSLSLSFSLPASLPHSPQHLIESLWYAVLETFILLAAFHQELNFSFVTTVMTLFVVKSFHWLANDRVDFVSNAKLIHWVFNMCGC